MRRQLRQAPDMLPTPASWFTSDRPSGARRSKPNACDALRANPATQNTDNFWMCKIEVELLSPVIERQSSTLGVAQTRSNTALSTKQLQEKFARTVRELGECCTSQPLQIPPNLSGRRRCVVSGWLGSQASRARASRAKVGSTKTRSRFSSNPRATSIWALVNFASSAWARDVFLYRRSDFGCAHRPRS